MLEQTRSEKLINSNQELLNKLISPAIVPKEEATSSPHMEPLPIRKPQWGKIRAQYEAKKRNEYWQSKIAEIEEKDKKNAEG